MSPILFGFDNSNIPRLRVKARSLWSSIKKEFNPVTCGWGWFSVVFVLCLFMFLSMIGIILVLIFCL